MGMIAICDGLRRHDVVTWRGIVKVQRNLAGYDGERKVPIPAGSTVLFTSEDGVIHWQGPADDELAQWFTRKDKWKFFAEAELRGTIIGLIRKAPWQDW